MGLIIPQFGDTEVPLASGVRTHNNISSLFPSSGLD